MEPFGIHGVSVAASANALNPLHFSDDEGAHAVLESSVGRDMFKSYVATKKGG